MFRSSGHLFGAATAILAAVAPMPAGDAYESQRERMVREQIEARGIRRADVLRVIRLTPRHAFLPESIRAMAYGDCALPIGFGATVSQPYIVALMTELLQPQKDQRVLEIGTGSGYQAAILSQLAKQVYTIEIVPELAEAARQRLDTLGYTNVTVRHGDGYRGWPEKAPFDGIIVTAAPAEVPRVLLDQLASGGRLIVPVGVGWAQDLTVFEKRADGTLARSSVAPVIFVPMRAGDR